MVPELLEWYYHLDYNAWDVTVKLPNSETYLQDLRMHKWMEDAIMPYPFLDYNNAEWIRGAEASICRIEHTKVYIKLLIQFNIMFKCAWKFLSLALNKKFIYKNNC